MADYEPLDLGESCNAGLDSLGGGRRPPIGDQMFHGLPFRIGDPARPEAACFVRVMPGESVSIPVDRIADRVKSPGSGSRGGRVPVQPRRR